MAKILLRCSAVEGRTDETIVTYEFTFKERGFPKEYKDPETGWRISFMGDEGFSSSHKYIHFREEPAMGSHRSEGGYAKSYGVIRKTIAGFNRTYGNNKECDDGE